MRAARLAWLGLLLVAGVLAVLPVTMTASGLARWDEVGPGTAHHADAIVVGRVSPWPVDSDEQLVAVGLGLPVATALVAAALAVHLVLRRRLAVRAGTGALVGVAVWCAPSVLYWLTWPVG